MNLQEFTEKALNEIISAVEKVRTTSVRDLRLSRSATARAIEFDIAVTVATQNDVKGKAEIKVISVVGTDVNASRTSINSTVTRVRFGVQVEPLTKGELAQQNLEEEEALQNYIKG